MFAAVGGTAADSSAGHFVRHLGKSGVLTTASSDEDRRDVTWRLKPALCQPGTGKCPPALKGSPKCVSLESANWAGWFLTHQGAGLTLAKASGESWAQATFCYRKGLSDESKVSFESLDKPGHFIRHNLFQLYICDNTNQGGCGRTSLEKFRMDATFDKREPEFFGLCEGPEQPQKCRARTCKCEKGYLGEDCNVKCPTSKDGDVCSGHGTCFLDAKTNQPKCVCDKSFSGDSCAVQCPTSKNGDVCNGHGKCSVDKGKAACECSGGFVGSDCEHNCPGSSKTDGKQACSGHGKCSLQGKKATCECAGGYKGAGCAKQCPKHNGAVCGGEGECYEDKGVPKCKCKPGFKGLKCELPCPGRTKDTVCGGNGKCIVGKSKKAECLCSKGFGGRSCSESCPFKEVKGQKVPCFGKGSCVKKGKAMQCMCKKGWLGPACDIPCPTSPAGEICGKRGMCLLAAAGDKAKCDCKDGFVGKECMQACPRGDGGGICSGHGKCRAHGNSAVCKCAKGHAGATCSKACPKDKDGVICNGNGKCALRDNKAQCECNDGFTGKDCEKRICTSENSLFDAKTSRCLCEPGFTCCSLKKLEALERAELATAELGESDHVQALD